MKVLLKIKNAWDRFIARLGASNKAAFGQGKLDCCKTGRENIKPS